MSNPISIALSGEARHGKDFVAINIRHSRVISLAEPLYALARKFFGTDDKAAPGIRDFLIKVGTWGRGDYTDDFPATPERALFTSAIRPWGHEWLRHADGYLVAWSKFGEDRDIWLNAAARRAEHALQKSLHCVPCIVNARFDNELSFFEGKKDWLRAHVVCSPGEARRRFERLGERPPPAGAPSEEYARRINSMIYEGKHDQLPKDLLIVWNDPSPSPSPGFFSVDDFREVVEDYRQGRLGPSSIRLNRGSLS